MKSSINRRLTLSIVLSAVAIAAIAAQSWEVTPLNGMVYHTTERSALTYDCSPLPNQELRCKFNQTAVRKKLTPDKVEERLAELEESLREIGPASEECKDAQAFVEEAGNAANKIKDVDARDRELVTIYLRGIEKACSSGDKADLRTALRTTVERDLRTCMVSSYQFEQTFKRVDGLPTNQTTWVTTGAPSGECGIVQLSRFERDGDATFVWWNYVARKAITNPRGEIPLLGSCSLLDEETYTYSWRSGDAYSRWAECDQIEFSAL